MDKGYVSARQLAMLLSLHLIGSAVLVIPNDISKIAGQDSWIASICSLAGAAATIPLYTALLHRFPGQHIGEILVSLSGQKLGRSLFLLYILCYPVLAMSLTIRTLGDFVVTQMMVETPVDAIILTFLALVAWGTWLGLETIGRSAEVCWPWVIAVFALLIAGLVPQFEASHILPVFEKGWKPIALATIPYIVYPYAEQSLWLMLFPRLHKPKQAGKVMLFGLLSSGLVLVVTVLVTLLVMGGQFIDAFPTYSLVARINVGDFLQRFEGAMAGIWFLTVFFRIATFMYIVSRGLMYVFNLQSHRMLLLPLILPLYCLSLIIGPNRPLINTVVQPWSMYSFCFALLLPLLLLLLGAVRAKLRSSNQLP